MKNIITMLIFLIAISSVSVSAQEDTPKIVQEEYALSGAESVIEDLVLPESVSEMLSDFDPEVFAEKLLNGEMEDTKSLLKKALRFFVVELFNGKEKFFLILLAAFLSGLIAVLAKGFGEGIGEIAFIPSYLLISSFSLSLFLGVADFVKDGLEFSVSFLNSSLPVFTTLVMASGDAASESLLRPGITIGIFTLANLIRSVIFPAIFVSAVFGIVTHLSKTVPLQRLNKLLKKTIRLALCLIATVFVSYLSVSQVAARALNGVGVRTGKFVIGNLVPVVGGFLAETLDTLFTCAGVVRGVFGVVGVSVLAVCFVSLLIRILARIWLLQLASAFSEPIGDARVSSMLSELSESMSLLLGALSCAMVSFVIYLAMLIRVGNYIQ